MYCFLEFPFSKINTVLDLFEDQQNIDYIPLGSPNGWLFTGENKQIFKKSAVFLGSPASNCCGSSLTLSRSVSEIMTSSKGAGTRWAAWKRGHLGPWANVITLLLKWSWFLHLKTMATGKCERINGLRQNFSCHPPDDSIFNSSACTYINKESVFSRPY